MYYCRLFSFLLAMMLCAGTYSQLTPSIEVFMKPGLTDPKEKKTFVFAGAKYEPPTGCYLGAYIELDPFLKATFVDQNQRIRKLPEEFEAIVRKPHAMYFFYLGYGTPLPTDWVQLLHERGKLVHIALEPNNGLNAVQDDLYLQSLAGEMQATGAKIFLRFASEMNGTWTNYGGNPKLYREKFRLVADVMKRMAPNVAMVWCPYTTPRGNINDYYPGDAYVDWVGVNMYNVTFFDQDLSKPATHIKPTDMLDPIYRNYAKRKPIMIGEYGTTHFSAIENKRIVEYAVRNIKTLYASLRDKYPRVKAINYFNSNNLQVAHRKNNNYTVTTEPTVRSEYSRAIASKHFLSAPISTVSPPPTSPNSVLLQDDSSVPRLCRIFVKLDQATIAFFRFSMDNSVVHSEWLDGLPTLVINGNKMGLGQKQINFEGFDSGGKLIVEKRFSISIGSK